MNIYKYWKLHDLDLEWDCRWLTVEESFFFFRQFGVLLAAKSLGVVRFVPLSEWGRIDGDDATFDQSLGSDQFVVGGVVDNIDNTNFSCNGFSSPGEVAWWTVYDPRYSWYNVSIDNTRSSDGRIQNRDQGWSLEICPFPRNYIWKPLSRTKLESRTPPHHYEWINMSRRIEFMTICIWRYNELFTLVQSEGSVLHVTTTSTDMMDTVWSQFGHWWWTTHKEGTLLSGLWAFTTSSTTLMFWVPGNTHGE